MALELALLPPQKLATQRAEVGVAVGNANGAEGGHSLALRTATVSPPKLTTKYAPKPAKCRECRHVDVLALQGSKLVPFPMAPAETQLGWWPLRLLQ